MIDHKIRMMEQRLHQLLSQGVLDLLDFLRTRTELMPGINYPAYQLMVPLLMKDQNKDAMNVEVLVGADDKGAIFISKWPDRLLETHYLLRGEYLPLNQIEEAVILLESTAMEVSKTAQNWPINWELESPLKRAIKALSGGTVMQEYIMIVPGKGPVRHTREENVQQNVTGQPTTGTGDGTVGVGTGVDSVTAAERSRQEGIVAQLLRTEEEQNPGIGG